MDHTPADNAEDKESAALGRSIRRSEDRRLVTGRGRFVDDNKSSNMVWACFVRSLYPHADIKSIDDSFAADMPGVISILTGEDYKNDGLGDIPCASIPPEVMKSGWFKTPFPALAGGRVRSIGQAIAMVIAESREQAMDAAEAMMVEYESLPAVTEVMQAVADDAPRVWDDCPDNISFSLERGSKEKTDEAFAKARHVLSHRIHNQRVAGNPLEPRCYIGDYDQGKQRYHLTTCSQSPHRVQNLLAEHVFKVPVHQIHVVSEDVGGGFGTKGSLYPEEALVLWASKRVGRPVKWLSDRSESFLSDFNGRDQVADAEVALDDEGRILGLRVVTHTNMGCQLGPSAAHPPLTAARLSSGTYAIPAIHITAHAVLTHTMTLTTYRGAGRPEAAHLLERMIDMAAQEFGFDPVAIRQLNLIDSSQMPYQTATGETYDCGEFRQVLDKTLALADWQGFRQRREQSEAKGLLRGQGVSMYIEVCAVLSERMEIRFDPSGQASIVAGTCATGQGHETVFAQMLAGWLGLPIADIHFIQGDTDTVSYGRGSYASRSMAVGGPALKLAAEQVIEKGKKIVAHLFNKDESQIEFEAGLFRTDNADESMTLKEVAKACYAPTAVRRLPAEFASGLEGVAYYSATKQNYPNGCHVAEVEVDPETGVVTVDKYSAIDESGVIINPLLFHGQSQGGIVQGVGQALMESVVYNDDGQLISGGFTDYAMPRAADFPSFQIGEHCTPTQTNPLGVKGGGEGGTTGASPAIMNAIVDALKVYGIKDIDMPATSLKIWQAIQSAQVN